MKTPFFRFILCLLVSCLSYVTINQTVAAPHLNVGEPRTVQLIYFIANDQQFDDEVAQKMKDGIRTTQTFYAEQMEAHGYENMTFKIETDDQGEPVVHRIQGKHDANHYNNNYQYSDRDELEDEIRPTINLRENISLVVETGRMIWMFGRRAHWGKRGALAIVSPSSNWQRISVELGYAFGLWSDYRDETITGLSACDADFLSVHPFFNTTIPIEYNPPPVVELISLNTYRSEPTTIATYQSGPESISLRFRVTDINEGHQVTLLVDTSAPSGRRLRDSRYGWEVNACKTLAGDIFTEVEFDFDGRSPSDKGSRLSTSPIHNITISAVDKHGNSGRTRFILTGVSPSHVASLKGSDLSTDRISIPSVAFSPSEQIVAGGSWGNTMLWDLKTHSLIDTLPHKEGINTRQIYGGGRDSSFSSDGTILAVHGGDNFVKLWNMTTRESIMSLEHTNPFIQYMAFSPNNDIIAASGDKNVILWDLATGNSIATLTHQGRVYDLAFSPDGRILATSESYPGAIRFWDVETKTETATILNEYPTAIAFTPNGDMLLSASNYTIKLWNAETKANIKTIDFHRSMGRVTSISCSPDGKTFAVGTGSTFSHAITDEQFSHGTIQIWDMETFSRITSFAHTEAVYSIVFSPDGNMLAAGSRIGTVELWDATEWKWPNYQGKLLLEYTLSVSTGTNLIHIPLKVTSVDSNPQTIESISDVYDALGGIDAVNLLGVYDNNTKGWIHYAGNQDKDTDVDRKLTDDMGIMAVMNRRVSIKMEGYALGSNGKSSITLQPGTNLVGIPLKDSRLLDISDLLTLDGIRGNVSSIIVSDNGIYRTITQPEDDGNTLITGGRAFMLIAQQASTVSISGIGWANTTGAAPSISENIKPVESSMLLPNYPNPFNPETWIPFRLAEDATVTLTIYDKVGRVVRGLDIGHKKAGVYETRNKAIYWDGKNDLGESMASGVYFYHLKAGKYSATKRMVILK